MLPTACTCLYCDKIIVVARATVRIALYVLGVFAVPDVYNRYDGALTLVAITDFSIVVGILLPASGGIVDVLAASAVYGTNAMVNNSTWVLLTFRPFIDQVFITNESLATCVFSLIES